MTLSTAPAVDKEVPGVDAATGLRDVNPVTHWKQTIWFNSQELAPVRKFLNVPSGGLPVPTALLTGFAECGHPN